MNNEQIDVLVENFTDSCFKILSKGVNIFLGNGEDLLELDMNDFNTETYFISDMTMERGKIIHVLDEELRANLYKFCATHEDRVFRGTRVPNYKE